MYQRLVIAAIPAALLTLAAYPEDNGYGETDGLIGDKKKHARKRRHYEYHCGRNRGFAARRPGHFLDLRAHFPQKLERTFFRHHSNRHRLPRFRRLSPKLTSCRWDFFASRRSLLPQILGQIRRTRRLPRFGRTLGSMLGRVEGLPQP